VIAARDEYGAKFWWLMSPFPCSMLQCAIEILKLLRGLQETYNLSVIILRMIFTVSYISERIFVMYAGI